MEKTIKEAMEITRNDVADNLEGLPPVKCTVQTLQQMHYTLLLIITEKIKEKKQRVHISALHVKKNKTVLFLELLE